MFIETKNLYIPLYNATHILHDIEGYITIHIP